MFSFLEGTILDFSYFAWPYNLYFDLFAIFLIVVIGVPTVYAMLFGAPWVPTPSLAVAKMVEKAKLKKGDKVYDLGCGDGRLLFEASRKKGVQAIGYEISPLVYLIAVIRNLLNGWKVKIYFKSYMREDLSEADVVFLYLLPKAFKRLVTKFKKELKKGSLVISYAFKIDELELVERIERNKEKGICPIWIYRI